MIDGDSLREACHDDLPHGPKGVMENCRRLIEYAKRQLRDHQYVISAFVAPNSELRQQVKTEITGLGARFVQVYVHASVETCVERDVKGLYARQRSGEDIHLAGINENYDEVIAPDLVCDTERFSAEECAEKICRTFIQHTDPLK